MFVAVPKQIAAGTLIAPGLLSVDKTVIETGAETAAGQTPFVTTALTYKMLAPYNPEVQLEGFPVCQEPEYDPAVVFH